MSARLTPRNILGKPVTKREFLDVLAIFEENIDRKIWSVLPWYKKLWRYFRGPYRANRRKTRAAQRAAKNTAAAKRENGAGEQGTQNGQRPVSAGAP